MRRPSTILFVAALLSLTTAPIIAQDRVFASSFEDGELASTLGRQQALRFLDNTTFGADEASINELLSVGYNSWLTRQMALPQTRHLPTLQSRSQPVFNGDRVAVWWQHSINAPDQLRQRVAFALSQIFVVSDRAAATSDAQGLANYYDLLAAGAFGSYRQLLEEVTLSPMMGLYLSMLGNAKADPVAGTIPDQNFAREVMQLFSIGLVVLNNDGSALTSNGLPVPTYSQPDIEALSRAFTGYTFGGADFFPFPSFPPDYFAAMQPFDSFHDLGEKRLLGGSVILPAGQSASADLAGALDALANHPNVGPFIGRQLIQRLVTSNPSPAYVARVSAVFNDNGAGVRGDLGAVVRAIVTDIEALSGSSQKLTEPLLRVSQLWRMFEATPASGNFDRYAFPNGWALQSPLSAPSVFNFYRPNYSPAGPVNNAGLVAPEFQITTESSHIAVLNELSFRTLGEHSLLAFNDPDAAQLNLSREAPLAQNVPGLVDHLDQRLFGGAMPAVLRQTLLDGLPQISIADGGGERIASALYLIYSSPHKALGE